MNIISHSKKLNTADGISDYKYSLLAFWFFLIFTVGYLLKSPTLGAESVRSSLNVCAHGLIPGIFPFVVLVNMISSSGLPSFLGKAVGKFVATLFRTDENAAYAFILGILGGFPIGAVCVGNLYKDKIIDKNEAERLCAAVNIASPAFCIGAIGSIFSDTSFGIRLYFCQLAAALTVLLLSRGSKNSGKKSKTSKYIPPVKIMTDAIAEGGKTMIKICSYVIFFAVIGDGVCQLIESLFGQGGGALTASLFEITLAARKSAQLTPPLANIICAFSVGYSGISVHMQTTSVMGFSAFGRHYQLRRIIQGILCAVYVYLTSPLQL